MDKAEFERLKGIDIGNIQWHVFDAIRHRFGDFDSLPVLTAVSSLALVQKELQAGVSFHKKLTEMFPDQALLDYLQVIYKEHTDLVVEVSDKYDVDTLNAAVLFAEPKRFTQVDENTTPESISDLAIALLELKKEDVVLDLGSGFGSFLFRAALISETSKLYGVELNKYSILIAKMRQHLTGAPIDFFQGNVISEEFTRLSANKVFSNHPLVTRIVSLQKYIEQNSTLHDYFRDAKKNASGDWVFGLAAYLNTRRPGRTVMVMSNAGTWNKTDEDMRKQLLDMGVIEGVILLPERLLSLTGISLTMIVLSSDNKEVMMVDASEVFSEGRRQNFLEKADVAKILKAYYHETKISKKITTKELAACEHILNPQRYIDSVINIKNGVPLGDLCETINRGAQIRSVDLDKMVSKEKTRYRYLMLKNIRDGMVDSNLPSLKHIVANYSDYCIKDSNLIISKNYPFKVALARIKEDETVLANGNLYFFELDESKVNPVYVQVFLQSEAGMAQLNRFAKGTAMKSISIQDLKRVQIPQLSRSTQDKIAEEYQDLCDELIILRRQSDIIRDKKERLIEEVL